MTREFLKRLEQNLKVGNLRGIHLNSLPGRFATRLDLFDLSYLNPELPRLFLDQLLSKSDFNFQISLDRIRISELDEEKQRQINLIAKRLNSMFYENNDNYLEHGIKTFGFGYPLVAKRTKRDPTKIIKAPLIIWSLDIEKSPRKVNEWFIRRTEDYSISQNAVLSSQLESDEQLQVKALSADVLEDGIVDKSELLTICDEFLKTLSVEQSPTLNIDIKKCPDRDQLENLISDVPSIIWSGIFGLYRAQKESIIRDLKALEENFDQFKFELLKFEKYQTTTLSGVATDPSQEEILGSLGTKSSKIIQGPPGTGKSQSLTALVTNALESKAKCLVVCEKKTALDVIFNNLKEIGLESFSVVIDDVSKDRKHVVDAARAAVEGLGGRSTSFRENEYKQKYARYEQLKEKINRNNKAVLALLNGDDSWKDIVGRYLHAQKDPSAKNVLDSLDTKGFQFEYDEYQNLVGTVRDGQRLWKPVGRIDHPLNVLEDGVFNGSYSFSTEEDIRKNLKKKAELAGTLIGEIEVGHKAYRWMFDQTDFISNAIVGFLSLFYAKALNAKSLKAELKAKLFSLVEENHNKELFDFDFSFFNEVKTLSETVSTLQLYMKKATALSENMDDFESFYEWKSFLLLLDKNARNLVLMLAASKTQDWVTAFEAWYFDNLLKKHEVALSPFHKDSTAIDELGKLSKELKQLQKEKIRKIWREQLARSIERFRNKNGNVKTLYNYRKNNEHAQKNSLRKIIHTDFSLFTDFFPVVLANPTACASIMPLKEGLFDIVIFDEASQLRLEDTFSSLVRGKCKIVSGDRHQMPPSSYFMGGRILADNEDYEKEAIEEEAENLGLDSLSVLAESESLLKFAEDSGYHCSYLDFHYRSRHPFLIDFSNAAFYGSRLVPMPQRTDYRPIRLIQVDGVYEKDGTNPEEARQVVKLLVEKIKADINGTVPSVGVATFNIYQRNLILDLLRQESITNPSFSEKYQKMVEGGLFVKNLENIQGDERDVIIISTTFGRMVDGTFRQNFGPINQQKGYRLLNVIITRAKHHLYLLTSIPAEYFERFHSDIEGAGNVGKGIFYAYLSYANSVENRDYEKRERILDLLRAKCGEAKSVSQDSFVESPFEQEVFDILGHHIDSKLITPQKKIGGFRVDFLVQSPNKAPIVIECDGKSYHSSNEAYAYDVFRQEQLEQLGYKVYRIWSTNWWRRMDEEIHKLLQFIENAPLSKAEVQVLDTLMDAEMETRSPATSSFVREGSPSRGVTSAVRVGFGALLTIKDVLKKEILRMRITSLKKEEDLSSQNVKIIHRDAPLARALWGKCVGETCRLDGIEAYYEIVDIAPAA